MKNTKKWSQYIEAKATNPCRKCNEPAKYDNLCESCRDSQQDARFGYTSNLWMEEFDTWIEQELR